MSKAITEKHQFMIKVNSLYEIMEELGISIDYGGTGGLLITNTVNNISYRLKDKDSSEYLAEFPTSIEFKLTTEN